MMKLVMLYRILNHLVRMESSSLTKSTNRTCSHSLRLTQPFARIEMYVANINLLHNLLNHVYVPYTPTQEVCTLFLIII